MSRILAGARCIHLCHCAPTTQCLLGAAPYLSQMLKAAERAQFVHDVFRWIHCGIHHSYMTSSVRTTNWRTLLQSSTTLVSRSTHSSASRKTWLLLQRSWRNKGGAGRLQMSGSLPKWRQRCEICSIRFCFFFLVSFILFSFFWS